MKKLLLLIYTMTCLALYGRCQIVHHDITPDSTFGGGSALSFYTLTPPAVAQFVVFWAPGNRVYLEVHGSFGTGEVLMNGDYPAMLAAGADIMPTGTWFAAAGPSGFLHSDGNGNWRSDATDKYLGFRFKTMAGTWHYGWLKMTVAAGAASFTVKEWAYQSVAGTGIKAGATTPTGIGNLTYDPGIGVAVSGRTVSFLNLEAGHKYHYLVTDVTGRKVLQGKVAAGATIQVQSPAAGVYLLRLYGNGYNRCFKIPLP